MCLHWPAVAPLFLAALVASTSACYVFTASCRSVSELRLVRDTPEARRLIVEQGNRDGALEAFWKQPHSELEGLQRVNDMAGHPERYTVGRKQFLEALAQQPVVSLPTGTYLSDVQDSAAKC